MKSLPVQFGEVTRLCKSKSPKKPVRFYRPESQTERQATRLVFLRLEQDLFQKSLSEPSSVSRMYWLRPNERLLIDGEDLKELLFDLEVLRRKVYPMLLEEGDENFIRLLSKYEARATVLDLDA